MTQFIVGLDLLVVCSLVPSVVSVSDRGGDPGPQLSLNLRKMMDDRRHIGHPLDVLWVEFGVGVVLLLLDVSRLERIRQ